MSVEVKKATRNEVAEWNSYVEQSPHTGFFHRREVIEALAEHADCPVRYLVGFKGQEPVGLFPVFEITRGPVTAVFSPPPALRIPYQGPAMLNTAKLKQRKAERRRRQFLEGCIDLLDSAVNPRYVHIRLTSAFPDLRPLQWRGFDPTPRYTYLVDLSVGRDDLLASFSSDARRNIRDGQDTDGVTVQERGKSAIPFVLDQVRKRYEQQGIAFDLPTALVTDLAERVPERSVRAYVCRVDGRTVGGILTYEHDGTIYRWQGGVKPDTDVGVAVNDLLDWHVMTDAIEREFATYDLVGADNESINEYKAKFNPELQPFYSLERGSTPFRIAAHLYDRLRSVSALTRK